MRTSTGYQFTAQEAERLLKISVSRSGNESAVLVSALNATAGGAGVSLTYTLGTEAVVSIAIRNISGRLVQQLASGVAQEAGAGIDLEWKESDRGRGARRTVSDYC